MSRSSPSRCSASRVALALAVLGVAGLALPPGARAQVCEPLSPSTRPELAACREPGPTGSDRRVAGGEGGPWVELAASPEEASPRVALRGEALLALPKQPDGTLPGGWRLAPGARVADSYFSPLLCATVARVVGDPGAVPDSLVADVPEGGLVVPHHVYRGAGAAVRPAGADPLRRLQYGLDQLGVEAARPLGDGGGVRVALLDSAPETGHPELGRVRLAPLADGPPSAPAAHGTLVAGVIAAAEGNGAGIAGVAPGAELVGIPICSPRGASAADECRLYDALRGLDRAWEEEVAVVNLAVVGPPNALLERALRRLDELRVLVVAAAGNEGTREPRYPAAYPSVIGVGAHDAGRRPYARGNGGPSAELSAPGVEIVSTHPPGSYAFADGTSLAAAHVTGLLAVLVGVDGDPLRVRTALFRAAARPVAGPGPLPPACEVLARLGRTCPAP